MANYNLGLTIENIKMITRMFLDIFIVWMLIYYAIKIVKNNSRTIQIFKGIILILVVDGLAKILGLNTVSKVANMFVNWGFLAIIIVFQPEIRSLLERLGKSNVFSRITTLTGNEREDLVNQLVTAVMLLSQDQTGALISLEQSQHLTDYIKTGTPINSVVTAELLTSIFVTSTPLHDGAVIIQGDRIACASAYFPPTNLELSSKYGARHRAAIGISEITDAITVVVSEETGTVSITEAGKLINVDRKQLRDYLMRVVCGEENEINPNTRKVSLQDDEHEEDVEHTSYSTTEEPYIVDDAVVKSNTSVLSKLAIKRHDANKKSKNKTKANKDAKNHHRLGKNDKTKVDEMLDHEEASIKLPKKKKRPIPSYPDKKSNFEEEEERKLLERLMEADKKARQEDIKKFDISKLKNDANLPEKKPVVKKEKKPVFSAEFNDISETGNIKLKEIQEKAKALENLDFSLDQELNSQLSILDQQQTKLEKTKVLDKKSKKGRRDGLWR